MAHKIGKLEKKPIYVAIKIPTIRKLENNRQNLTRAKNFDIFQETFQKRHFWPVNKKRKVQFSIKKKNFPKIYNLNKYQIF